MEGRWLDEPSPYRSQRGGILENDTDRRDHELEATSLSPSPSPIPTLYERSHNSRRELFSAARCPSDRVERAIRFLGIPRQSQHAYRSQISLFLAWANDEAQEEWLSDGSLLCAYVIHLLSSGISEETAGNKARVAEQFIWALHENNERGNRNPHSPDSLSIGSHSPDEPQDKTERATETNQETESSSHNVTACQPFTSPSLPHEPYDLIEQTIQLMLSNVGIADQAEYRSQIERYLTWSHANGRENWPSGGWLLSLYQEHLRSSGVSVSTSHALVDVANRFILTCQQNNTGNDREHSTDKPVAEKSDPSHIWHPGSDIEQPSASKMSIPPPFDPIEQAIQVMLTNVARGTQQVYRSQVNRYLKWARKTRHEDWSTDGRLLTIYENDLLSSGVTTDAARNATGIAERFLREYRYNSERSIRQQFKPQTPNHRSEKESSPGRPTSATPRLPANESDDTTLGARMPPISKVTPEAPTDAIEQAIQIAFTGTSAKSIQVYRSQVNRFLAWSRDKEPRNWAAGYSLTSAYHTDLLMSGMSRNTAQKEVRVAERFLAALHRKKDTLTTQPGELRTLQERQLSLPEPDSTEGPSYTKGARETAQRPPSSSVYSSDVEITQTTDIEDIVCAALGLTLPKRIYSDEPIPAEPLQELRNPNTTKSPEAVVVASCLAKNGPLSARAIKDRLLSSRILMTTSEINSALYSNPQTFESTGSSPPIWHCLSPAS